MNTRFDVIVVGVGTMGSAAVYQLAKRGVRVLGLEQFSVPHALGAHHGFSRMIRLCYFEYPDYVPLLRRAYDLWHELEAECGQKIIEITGGLYMGAPGDSPVLDGSLASVRKFDLPHELLSHAELARRFPQFVVPEDYQGLHDHRAGLIYPERAVSTYAELALRRGAEIHGHEPVVAWHAQGDTVRVTTTRDTYEAGHVVFCGGAWMPKLIPDLGTPLTVTRQTLAWVWPRKPETFALGRMPVWILDHRDGTNHYGFPMLPDNPGLKLAAHKRTAPADPDRLNRDAAPQDEADVRWVLRDHLPDGDGPLLAIRACMYTNSADHQFIVDRHPRHANVTIASPCSGHGFKFGSVMGEVLADLATTGRTAYPIGFLGLDRFRSAAR